MNCVVAVRQHEHDDFDLAIPVDFQSESLEDDTEAAIREMYDVLDYDNCNSSFTATHEDHGDETTYYFYLIPVVGGEN